MGTACLENTIPLSLWSKMADFSYRPRQITEAARDRSSRQTDSPRGNAGRAGIAWLRAPSVRSLSLRIIVLWSISFCAAGSQAQGGSASLAEQIRTIATAHHGNVALFAENLKTHETVAISPDTPVQTASVIKLAILYEALEQVRNGKAHFDDKITLTKVDQVPGSGVLLFFDTPLSLTLKDVLTMMIVMSDNSGSNLAMDHLGIENVDARIAKLGLKDTYLYKKIFTPVPAGMVMPADQKKFGLGKTTAREMAALMTKIVRCELADPGTPVRPDDAALCEVALKMLHVQFYRSALPRYLDGMPGATSDSIANKTGSLNAVRNDVAAISTKNGMVIISAFTFDNKDTSWGAEQEGELTIAKLARTIVQSWSPDGLAAWPTTTGKALPAGQ
jgi:beta-lactamase class A